MHPCQGSAAASSSNNNHFEKRGGPFQNDHAGAPRPHPRRQAGHLLRLSLYRRHHPCIPLPYSHHTCLLLRRHRRLPFTNNAPVEINPRSDRRTASAACAEPVAYDDVALQNGTRSHHQVGLQGNARCRGVSILNAARSRRGHMQQRRTRTNRRANPNPNPKSKREQRSSSQQLLPEELQLCRSVVTVEDEAAHTRLRRARSDTKSGQDVSEEAAPALPFKVLFISTSQGRRTVHPACSKRASRPPPPWPLPVSLSYEKVGQKAARARACASVCARTARAEHSAVYHYATKKKARIVCPLLYRK